MPTTKLGLPTIAGNASADVVRDLNALANAVDDKAGVAEGLATLGADGKVPGAQVPVAPNASTTVAGKVMLSSSVTSASEGLAATPKAVKSAYDLAVEAKTQANDQKTKWAAVVGSPLLSTDTSTVLQSKTQTIKNDLAANLTAKGQTAAGSETLTSLVNKVASVETGKKWAKGTASPTGSNAGFTVTGLAFRPSTVIVYMSNTTQPNNYGVFAILKDGNEMVNYSNPVSKGPLLYGGTNISGQQTVIASNTFNGITNDGFTTLLTKSTASDTYTWEAYE